MGRPYWINKANNNFYLHFKITQPAGSKVIWTVNKDDSQIPENPDTFWDFFDDFNGESLDTTKWDPSKYKASYSISDSNFNTWGDSGSCCNGSCYYSAIRSKTTFNLPIRVLLAGNQEPYTEATNCGKTGPYILYGNSIEFIPSTDNNSDACAYRIGNTSGTIPGSTKMPDLFPEYFMYDLNLNANGFSVEHCWWTDEKVKISGSPSQTTNQWVGFGGDTDSTGIVDHIGFIAITKSHEKMPEIKIISQNDKSLLIQVDDSKTGNIENFVDFIVTIKLPDGWITSVDQGLNIINSTVYILVENPEDNNVYTWDGNLWKNLNKTKNDLTSNDFINFGIKAPLLISKTNIEKLTNNPNILFYCESSISELDMNIKFLPYPRLIIQRTPFNLKDFTKIKKLIADEINVNWTISEPAFYTLISRDNKNWYKWDTTYNKWQLVGTKILNIYEKNDIDWVKNNGIDLKEYLNLGETEWNNFFEEKSPDYLFFAITFDYHEIDQDKRLNYIGAIVNTKNYYKDDTETHDIRFTENNLSIKFNNSGTYKINYID